MSTESNQANLTADAKAANEAAENTATELKEEELNDVAGGSIMPPYPGKESLKSMKTT